MVTDVNPAYKNDDCSNKRNHMPVTILPTVSKVFSRLMNADITNFIEWHFSNRLRLRHRHSAQTTLSFLLKEMRKHLDKGCVGGMLLTDLSNAFDCLVNDHKALQLVYCYLSSRKLRTKVCTLFSN